MSLSLWGQLKPYALTVALVVTFAVFKVYFGDILIQQNSLILFALDCVLAVAIIAAFRLSQRRGREGDEKRQSQYLLDSIVENIPNMIFVKDAVDLKFVSFNRAGEQLTGISRKDLLGKSDFDFFPEDQAEAFRQKDRQVLEGREVVYIPEEPLETRHGRRYLSTKKIPIVGPDGSPKYLLGISEDITDRKEVERQRLSLMVEQAARREAEKTAARFSFLSRASAALTETLDPEVMLRSFARAVIGEMADACIVAMFDDRSEKAQLTTAYKSDIFAGVIEDWTRRYPIDWSSTKGVAGIIRAGQSRLYKRADLDGCDEIFQTPEQAAAFKAHGIVSLIAVPIQSFGKVLGAIIFISGSVKKIFDDLDFSVAEDLARRVFFATENARLYHRAQEASRAKSTFLANMSHEIRTPLGAMLGFTELMLDGENRLTRQQQHFLSTIERNGRQLLKIVDEVLDISKVESERLYIERLPFLLANLVEDVSSLLRRKAQQKNLGFHVRTTAPAAARIVSDPTRLRQILLNVIGNAIKFTEKGEVSVDVRLEPMRGMANKMLLEISVRDTGIGITEEQAALLFQPFAQADSSMARRFGGTGLGLFISRKLARLLGGDLVLRQSRLGEGSEFVLSVIADKVEECGAELPTGAGEAACRSKHIRGKVLVVDDSIDNREWLQYACERIGLDIDTAESGNEGVRKALANKYDAVLMDIQMPEMDGFKAIESLHAKNYKGVVIAVTAHAMKDDRENCLAKGFDDYLCKPLTRQSLEECLRKYLA